MKKQLFAVFIVLCVVVAFTQVSYGTEEKKGAPISLAQAKETALKLYVSQPVVILSTVDENGFPQARTMGNLRKPGSTDGNPIPADSLDTVFGSSTWRTKMEQVKRNPKASVYIVDMATFQSVTILGTIVVVDDMEFKKAAWSKSYASLYPKGYTSPDFSVLKFTALSVKVHTMDHNEPFQSLMK
jgi:general stress protein 26